MADAPVVVLAAPALEHPPLDDAVAEDVEADLGVAPRVAARGVEAARSRTDAR